MVVTGAEVPTPAGDPLANFAADVACQLGSPGSAGLVDLVPDRFPWIGLRFRELAAREGRQDALLCPRPAGGFLIVIDPNLSPGDVAAGRNLAEALDWRVAHELGHTFFFTGEPPRRWARWTPEEESLVDRFARLLLRKLQGDRRRVAGRASAPVVGSAGQGRQKCQNGA